MDEQKTYRFPGHKERMTRSEWLNEGNEEPQQKQSVPIKQINE